MISRAIGKINPVRIFYSIVLITGGFLVALVLMEAILRYVPGLLAPELYQLIRADPANYGIAHPYIGHLHRHNAAILISGRDFSAVHHTDGHGFRNVWPWPEKAEVVVLGDSLTFGYGVADHQAWPSLVLQDLPDTSLINLGLIGAGPQQYLRVYEIFGRKLRPKVVLVGFFVRNDFWDANMFARWLGSGAGGNYVVWRDFGRPRRASLSLQQPMGKLISSLQWRGNLLARKSHLYNFLLYAGGELQRRMPSETRIFQAPDGARLELTVGDLPDKTKEAQPGHRVFEMVINALQQLHVLARADRAKLVIVFQPSKEEVYLPLLNEKPADLGAPLRQKLRELGIPYLDLLQAFRDHAAQGETLFFEVDGHPNARGYGLTAELVLSHLKENAERYGLTGGAEQVNGRRVHASGAVYTNTGRTDRPAHE
jgi:lysophospholipase L1-like esterase